MKTLALIKTTKLLTASVSLLLIQPLAADAGFILFDDLGDNVIITISPDITARPGGFGVGTVPGSGTVFAPTTLGYSSPGVGEGPHSVGFFGPPGWNEYLAGFLLNDILEPGGSGATISDTLQVGDASQFGFDFGAVFTSDTESGPPLQSLGPQAIPIPEDGTIQSPASIVWKRDGVILATDFIQFRSDISDVPEPSTFAFCLMSAAFCGLTRLRARARTSSPPSVLP